MSVDSETLRKLLDLPEGQKLEFKRDWYDLSGRRGRATLARDVMAMANGLKPNDIGHIVFGREDPDRGEARPGTSEPPSQEQLTEILSYHTRPVPRIDYSPRVEVDGTTFSVIEVIWDDHHPHYATREIDGVLSADRVVVRQGATTRTLSPVELEILIRAKDARIGHVALDDPLKAGFVELPGMSRPDAAVVVRNGSEEPIDGIMVIVDVRPLIPPGLVDRHHVLGPLTLKAGERVECSFRPSSSHFYDLEGAVKRDDHRTWSRWFDLTLFVRYRGRDGTIEQIVREVAVTR